MILSHKSRGLNTIGFPQKKPEKCRFLSLNGWVKNNSHKNEGAKRREFPWQGLTIDAPITTKSSFHRRAFFLNGGGTGTWRIIPGLVYKWQ